MTVAQRVNEMYRAEREREILEAFSTITREEVLAMLENFIDLGIVTVKETETKVVVQLNRSFSSYHFYNVLNELDRTSNRRRNKYNCFGHLEAIIFRIEDASIQIKTVFNR